MDKELIEINQIKNIEYISFYDYTIPKIENDNGRAIIAPALMIKSNGKVLNYSVVDKYFRQFVQKVISVYHQEAIKANQEGALPSLLKRLSIDKRSEAVLDNASFLERNKITDFYQNKDSYDNSLIFQTDEIKSIMDIIRYAINEFSKYVNVNIKLSNDYRGYRNNYVIDCEKNGIYTNLIIFYNKKNDNCYQISIGNIGEACQPYVIDINFLNESIQSDKKTNTIVTNKLQIKGKYKDLIFDHEFEIGDTGATHLYEVTKAGEIVFYDVTELNKLDNPYENLVDLDYENDLTWYELPWKAYLGKKVSLSEIDDKTRIVTSQIMYLDIIDNNFYKREFYTKKLSRDAIEKQRPISLTIDNLRKITFGFRLGNNYLIETNFRDGFGDGAYNVDYNNRYFYHLSRVSTLSAIKRDKLLPITKNIIAIRDDLNVSENIKRIGVK